MFSDSNEVLPVTLSSQKFFRSPPTSLTLTCGANVIGAGSCVLCPRLREGEPYLNGDVIFLGSASLGW